MNKIYLLMFYEPGESHISALRMRAEKIKDLGLISEMPIITVEKAKVNHYHLVLDVQDKDIPFWCGFFEGMVYCVNNRAITVGV